MEQRNMSYSGAMLDMETEHAHLHPEACALPFGGGVTSFPQIRTILPPPRNMNTFESHHLPEIYGRTPYGFSQHFVTPTPSAGAFPGPMNHGIHNQFMDGINGAFKRKNAEGFPGNVQYFYSASGSSSSAAASMITDGAVMDEGSLAITEYRGNNDMALARNNSHLVHVNYGGQGQPLQAVPTPWLNQQFRAPAMPYIQGGTGAANMGMHGHQVTPIYRNSAVFVHPPFITPHQGPHNLYHQPPALMPPFRGQNVDFHMQIASNSPRLLTNSSTSYTNANPFPNGVEPVPRFVGPVIPIGVRVYRPHQRELMIQSNPRNHIFPHLRLLPLEGVAFLDITDYHEVGHSVDHHRDMRLDIEQMSYEDLVALGEQIGSAGSGLVEDFIVDHLKTRTFAPSKSSDASSADQELNFCVICQTDYNDQEKIGALDCSHEYHSDCIKKWLLVKNTCPICKSTALATPKMES